MFTSLCLLALCAISLSAPALPLGGRKPLTDLMNPKINPRGLRPGEARPFTIARTPAGKAMNATSKGMNATALREAREARRSAAGNAAAAPAAGGRQRRYQAPAATPEYLAKDQVSIILRWDTTESGGTDLDSILMDPQGCIIAAKGYNIGCSYGYSVSYMGTDNNPLEFTPYGGSSTLYLDPICDSTSSTSPNGAEVIAIETPDTSGLYHHCVYQYGDNDNGFMYASTAEVTLWANDERDWPAIQWSDLVSNIENWGTCNGRFWNTFSLSFTFREDDDTITSITPTNINSITTTPYVSFGTTSLFEWEAGVGSRSSDPQC